jgi:SAM-dependent methyltransferase
MSADAATAYDAVANPSQPIPQAHPDRLATLACLFGMSPAAVENCRVLELGCGDGSHLIPLAFTLPGSRFVGVDLARKAIAIAQEEAQGLKLANIEFHCADVLDWTPPHEQFDYIVAHGKGELSLPPGARREDLLADVNKAVAEAAAGALLAGAASVSESSGAAR